MEGKGVDNRRERKVSGDGREGVIKWKRKLRMGK